MPPEDKAPSRVYWDPVRESSLQNSGIQSNQRSSNAPQSLHTGGQRAHSPDHYGLEGEYGPQRQWTIPRDYRRDNGGTRRTQHQSHLDSPFVPPVERGSGEGQPPCGALQLHSNPQPGGTLTEADPASIEEGAEEGAEEEAEPQNSESEKRNRDSRRRGAMGHEAKMSNRTLTEVKDDIEWRADWEEKQNIKRSKNAEERKADRLRREAARSVGRRTNRSTSEVENDPHWLARYIPKKVSLKTAEEGQQAPENETT